jgi:hypothetical protein
MIWIIGAMLAGAAQANDDLPWSKESPEAAVYRAFLPRHPNTTCDEVSQKSSNPVGTLNAVVHGPALPPWVPMRAAACLLDEHLAAGETEISAWLADPELLGLARLVQRRLAQMPTPIASRLEKAAIAGPHQAVFQAAPQPSSQ